ncbi:MAG: ABC transporter ATP-binding protein [Roseiflexaceae bacterium]|nr:ABC transporter ATP-binding protein [Roseiflexaceae bacterium]
MADITLQNVTKRFGTTTAIDQVSFSISDGEFFVLLGPSGAGKTTTLRLIAGLEKQDAGSVLFNGEVVDTLAPPERDIAFVFQQYSLYPTMSVYDNMAFPLRSPLRRTPEPEVKRRIEDVAQKLRIGHLLARKTARLSGGEMQRVSIGRAIVRDPQIFLMDEPLSNLDAKLRESLRIELEHIQKTRGSTTLYVTHDQIEALTMADRIAVLDHGRVIQIGTPHDIYDRPATTFVAQLVGTPRINLLEATRSDGALQIADSPITLPLPDSRAAFPAALKLGVRPEDVTIRADGPFAGVVALVEPLGAETVMHIQAGKRMLTSTVPGIVSRPIGSLVQFDIARERLHYFAADGARVATQ